MLFGTDGVRGLVNKELTCELAYNIGKGLAINLIKNKKVKKVIIGKDTRLSGDTYMYAVASALCDYGINVDVVGIVPTPIISFLVSHYNYSGGVMITASHNDNNYNGIKVFSDFGEKVSKEVEFDIENNIKSNLHKTKHKGRIVHKFELVNSYIKYLINNFRSDLHDLKIIIDSANGSNYSIAPHVYKTLGANVIEVACKNAGNQINKNCGANHIENLLNEVLKHNADFGIAFDGDGDRLRIVLGDGTILSGDDILLYFALCLKNKNELHNKSVVGTIMTNKGVEDALNKNNISLIRTDVGDRNVIQEMRLKSISLGGESSGHICLYKHNTTCDALLNSLFFFQCYYENLIDFNNVMNSISKYPSITKNIEVDINFRRGFDSNEALKDEIKTLQTEFKNERIIVRPSGTEPVIRIYVEGLSDENNKKIVEKTINIIKK